MGGFDICVNEVGFIGLAGLKGSATTGLMLTATLVALNLPRISAWIVDLWKTCRVSKNESE